MGCIRLRGEHFSNLGSPKNTKKIIALAPYVRDGKKKAKKNSTKNDKKLWELSSFLIQICDRQFRSSIAEMVSLSYLIHDDYRVRRQIRVAGDLPEEQTLREEQDTGGLSPGGVESDLMASRYARYLDQGRA